MDKKQIFSFILSIICLSGYSLSDTNLSISELKIQANMLFFYYKNLSQAQDFYQKTLGFERVFDAQGASIHKISDSSFIGLVDGEKGLHHYSDEKAVSVSFISDHIDAWYD